MKPLRKSRRISAVNVFVQESLRNCGYRVGSDGHKQLLYQARETWNNMSDVERETYCRKAACQEAEVSSLQCCPLATSEQNGLRLALEGSMTQCYKFCCFSLAVTLLLLTIIFFS